jgi:hypothetical protein
VSKGSYPSKKLINFDSSGVPGQDVLGLNSCEVSEISLTPLISSYTLANAAAFAKLSGSGDGWITGPRGELLLWIPPQYWSFVFITPRSSCLLVIGRTRVMVDLSGFVHGTDWIRCFTSQLV